MSSLLGNQAFNHRLNSCVLKYYGKEKSDRDNCGMIKRRPKVEKGLKWQINIQIFKNMFASMENNGPVESAKNKCETPGWKQCMKIDNKANRSNKQIETKREKKQCWPAYTLLPELVVIHFHLLWDLIGSLCRCRCKQSLGSVISRRWRILAKVRNHCND